MQESVDITNADSSRDESNSQIKKRYFEAGNVLQPKRNETIWKSRHNSWMISYHFMNICTLDQQAKLHHQFHKFSWFRLFTVWSIAPASSMK